MEIQNQELATILAQMVADAVAPLYQAVAELKPKSDPRDEPLDLTQTKIHLKQKGAYSEK